MQSPDPGRDRSLDPGALLIVLLEGRLCLTLARGFQCLVLLLRAQRQKAPVAPGTLCLQRTGRQWVVEKRTLKAVRLCQ